MEGILLIIVSTAVIIASLTTIPVSAIMPEHKRVSRFQECRKKPWMGDVGELPEPKKLSRHPKDVFRAHSRKKRFVAFPSGSSLTVENSLTISKYRDSWKKLDLFIGLPFTLDLPPGKLKTIGTNLFDSSPHPSEGDDGTMTPMGDYYMSDHYGYGRSLDQERKTGFKFIEEAMNRFGFPGRSCLMKAVCDIADSPQESVGLFGDILAMFLSPGYGTEDPELDDYVTAEKEGRTNGSCSQHYKDCPFHLTDFLYSGLSLMRAGFSDHDS